MNAETVGSLILWLIVLAIVIVIAVYLLRWLYRRSTKETAFVRTGFGGEKVVISGGAFVVPVLHEITPVGMNVMRIEVSRRQSQGLITKNRMRVDVVADFFVRVGSTARGGEPRRPDLGRRTLEPEGARELLEGRFASALRTAAAQMTLEEPARTSAGLRRARKAAAAEGLAQNGLELESVAIVDLDQTGLEFFDSSNAFDAEGLTQLTETIEARRRMRNEIEQRTQIEIRTQNLEAQRRSLDIERDSEYARIAQEHDVEIRRAAQRVELAKDRAERERESRTGADRRARRGREVDALIQERNLAEARIQNQEEIEQREIVAGALIDEAEIRSREQTEREQIALELALETGADRTRPRAQRGRSAAPPRARSRRNHPPDRRRRQKRRNLTQAEADKQARRDRCDAGRRDDAHRAGASARPGAAGARARSSTPSTSPSARPSKRPRSAPAKRSNGRASQPSGA